MSKKHIEDPWACHVVERDSDMPDDHNRQPGRASDAYLARQLHLATLKWEQDHDTAARHRAARYLRQLCKRYGLRVGGGR